MALVAASPLGAPAELALARLGAALQQRGWSCRREWTPAARRRGRPGRSPSSPAGAGQHRAEPRDPACGSGRGTSDCSDFGRAGIAGRPPPAPAGGPPRDRLCCWAGTTRGLSYALLESARRVELEGPGPGAGPAALLDCFPPTAEAPQRPLRSLCVFPHNAVLDQEWYGSLDFWRWYFDLLALHRFNRFTLTFGHQTAYLAPPYPFFVPVPEHPEVRPTGFDDPGPGGAPGPPAGDRRPGRGARAGLLPGDLVAARPQLRPLHRQRSGPGQPGLLLRRRLAPAAGGLPAGLGRAVAASTPNRGSTWTRGPDSGGPSSTASPPAGAG